MVPEVAAAYIAGLVPSSALTALHLFLFRRKIKSQEMQTLQANLHKVNLFWSESNGEISTLEQGTPTQSERKYFKNVLIFGVIFFFLSWIGFFVQLLIMISLRYLAMPRVERALFASRLAKEYLTEVEVRSELQILRGTVMNSEVPNA
jgi:hypothetical protein